MGEVQLCSKSTEFMFRGMREAVSISRYNMFAKTKPPARETAFMKCSRTEVHCKTRSLPALRFEDSQLISFSGLILIQELFRRWELKERLRRCFQIWWSVPSSGTPRSCYAWCCTCFWGIGSCAIFATTPMTPWSNARSGCAGYLMSPP